ncbi:MAG TPA: hypothetical protein VEQ59_09935 [Polyangiaceae bacterium]|nr:hypothetical protein [Polyangiaceae bacterium]
MRAVLVRMTPSRSWLSWPGLWSACFLISAVGALPASTAEAAAPKTGVVAGSGTNAGGLFTAGPKGAEYLLPSLARLSLAPDAQVRLFPVPQPLQLTPGAKTTTYSFALLRGRVDVSVPTKPKSAVLCVINKVSAVVTAGQAAIVTHGDSSTLANLNGDVRALVGERWQTLSPGTLSHYSGEHASEPEPMLAAPALQPGQRLWFSPGDPVPIVGFSFNKVDRAARYELRLRNKGGGNEQVRSVRGSTQLSDPFSAVAPGAYEVATRSVDNEGIAGPWSTDQGVNVVGVSLPPGGYVAGGDIFIGKGQEVRFSNTDGLEMTYEGAGRYVPASQAVSLYRGETTVVSFRVPGSVYPTSARLRPRGLYAHLVLGPRRAVWPHDAVQVAIELRSKEGEAIPSWVELKTDVKVGIEPIEMEFTRSGNRLVGTVPPSATPGPWVLRVEVKDQFGALLGRDFLEIAKASAAPSPPAKTLSARVASK